MSEVLIQALRQQVEGLKLSIRQSNQITAKLMGTALTYEEREQLFQLVVAHVSEQELSRAAQLEAVMRTATMQLNAIAQTTEGPKQQELINVIKALTLTTECNSVNTKGSDGVRLVGQ